MTDERLEEIRARARDRARRLDESPRYGLTQVELDRATVLADNDRLRANLRYAEEAVSDASGDAARLRVFRDAAVPVLRKAKRLRVDPSPAALLAFYKGATAALALLDDDAG